MDRSIVGLIWIACATTCLATTGCGGATRAKRPPAGDGRERSPLVGVVTHYEPDGRYESFLTRLDGASLRPVGPRADVPELHATWSYSPDGRQVAVGTGGQGLGIHVYDVERMRLVRAIRTGIAAEALGWLEPRRLVAALQSGEIVVTDPRSGRVITRHRPRAGDGVCFAEGDASGSAAGGLAILLGARPSRPARLLLVATDGDVRTVALPAGGRWACDRAGLALEPGGRRAFVLERDGSVAEVDLAGMRATFHRLSGDPLKPASARRLAWLGDGRLVASGRPTRGRPPGVSVIDSAEWTNRTLDPDARTVTVAAGLALTYDGVEVDLGGRGSGLTAYDASGRRRFRVLAGKQVDFVHAAPGAAFAQSAATLRRVDLESGEVGKARRVPRTEIVILERPR
ncbi:MAG TPA: hypothetical protein VF529_13700 [Solirubrobacteraceae bacterium]